MRPPRLSPEDRRLWERIARSVEPGRRNKPLLIDPSAALLGAEVAPAATPGKPTKRPPSASPAALAPGLAPPARPATHRPAASAPDPLEPRRQRRLARERDPIEARLDLHGFGRFDAQDQVTAFLRGCQARGLRSVLLITGQGRRGGGVIRASVHEWLHAPALRGVVSGYSTAHRRHGGDGAIYVTLKRAP